MGSGGTSRTRDEYELVDERKPRRRGNWFFGVLIFVTIVILLGVAGWAGFMGWFIYSSRPDPTPGYNGTEYMTSPGPFNSSVNSATSTVPTGSVDPGHGPPIIDVEDAELLEVSREMWTISQPDMLSLGIHYTLNLGGHIFRNSSSRTDEAPNKLFKAVNVDVRTWTRTSETFVRLLDNYNYVIKVLETYTNADLSEIDDFLNAVFDTDIMKKLQTFLVKKGFVGAEETEYRELIRELWFGLYSRSPKYNTTDSSGFEHVFVGEIRKNTVKGFHSWIQLYLQEQAGLIDHQGYFRYDKPYLINMPLRWHNKTKQQSSFFLGTPPEYDLAVYSLCLVSRPRSPCPLYVDGREVPAQAWEVKHKEGLQVATAYLAL